MLPVLLAAVTSWPEAFVWAVFAIAGAAVLITFIRSL